MLKKVDENNKLLPLRKFAKAGLYSTSYLSQLVQRGKLRAKKIGRNYYTTEFWFQEYLNKHAHDKKYALYQQSIKKYPKIQISSENLNKEYIVLTDDNLKQFANSKLFIYKLAATMIAVFVLAVLLNWLNLIPLLNLAACSSVKLIFRIK